MIPPSEAPAFLASNGWENSRIVPLAGDASFRRYFRILAEDGRSAVLMDAPPAHEDLGPFLTIAHHLTERGFRAPRTLAVNRELGLLLLEDFGDDRVGPYLQDHPEREQSIYETAIDLLVELGREAAPAGLPLYDEEVMEREVALFTGHYMPALGMAVDEPGFLEAWRASWAGIMDVVRSSPVMVLRDYHVDNLMVLPGTKALGLLDFQDALAGHPAYDLVSLLQDARRDVDPELEERMLAHYAEQAGVKDVSRFRAHYEILGAQRNVKILGIFTRLWKRDGKDAYLAFQPRVWTYLERNLAHPALSRVREWFDRHVPPDRRADAWRVGSPK